MVDEVVYFISLNPLVILRYRIAQKFNIDEENFGGYWLIWWKMFLWIVTVFHYIATSVNAKQLDGLTIEGLTGKRQKRQNFMLYGILQTIVLSFILWIKLYSFTAAVPT